MLLKSAFVVSCMLTIISGKPDKFFRRGYKYFEETQSFYKFQTITKTWQDAKNSCELEGATLYYPRDEDEANVVLKFWNSTQTATWIYIGISTPTAIEIFETVDGLAIEDVYENWAPGEPNRYYGNEECVTMKNEENGRGQYVYNACNKKFAFICKKTLASLRWNEQCNIPDPEYIYYQQTGRCYKLHLTPKNWKDAYFTCGKEQARLAVINSEEEARILTSLVSSSPKDLIRSLSSIDGDYTRGSVHLGFKYDNGWKTYQGTDLRSSGYAKWGEGQHNGTSKSCGAMAYSGLLSDVSCEDKCFFICEHEINLLQNSLDYKYGDD